MPRWVDGGYVYMGNIPENVYVTRAGKRVVVINICYARERNKARITRMIYLYRTFKINRTVSMSAAETLQKLHRRELQV